MTDLDRVQNEINDKLEHGFDTRHIYQMFSTFVATIKQQADQIEEMQEHAERAEAQIENMGQTIRMMEMNIQGFVTLPPDDNDDEDEDGLKASRRPSVMAGPPQEQHRAIENAVNSIPMTTGSSESKPGELGDSQENILKSESGTPQGSRRNSRASTSGRRQSKSKSNAWKYKKRRIIRQMSQKLREEAPEDIVADDDNVSTPTLTPTETDDVKPVEEIKSTTPVDINNRLPDDNVDVAVIGAPAKDESEIEIELDHLKDGPDIIENDNSPDDDNIAYAETEVPQNEAINNNISGETTTPSIETSHIPGDEVKSRAQISPSVQISPTNKVSPRAETSPMTIETRTAPTTAAVKEGPSGKPPIGKQSSKDSFQDSNVLNSRQGSKRSSREFGTETPERGSRRGSGAYYDAIPQIDPTQTVIHRIGALEARLVQMSDLLNAQKLELEEVRRRPPSTQQQPAIDFFDNGTFIEPENLATQSFTQDVEDDDVDRDIDVRDEEKLATEQQDDVATVVKKVAPTLSSISSSKPNSRGGSRPVSKQGRPLDDNRLVRFNDQNKLQDSDVDIISKQICDSDAIHHLQDRILKMSEKIVDQGIKRVPKPPPPVTANDLLSDSIVGAIANSMLRRGLLDELRYENLEDRTPRNYSPSPVPEFVMQQPTPIDSNQSGTVSNADLKAISDRIVTKNDILAMIKDQIKRIPPPVSQPPAFSFTPYSEKSKNSEVGSEVTLAPKKYQEMSDDIPDSDTITVQDKSHDGIKVDPEVAIREATMGERAKTVLEQHVDVMEHEKASTSQLEGLARNMSMHVTMEIQKISSHYESLFEQLSSGMQERQDINERSVNLLRQNLYDLESSVSSQLQHAQRPSKKKDDEAWKSDLLKVSQSINKAREDQRTVAKMLVEELENLQNQMKNRVDENRLELLAKSIEDKVQQEMGQSVSGINSSMAKIIAAVRNKTDRNETEVMIQKKLREAEESLRILQDDEEPAGAFKCISCGTGGKRMSPNTSLESLSFASVIMSQSAEVQRNRGGDIDQTAAVLSRQAGLRPVSRQQKPMTPKVYTPTSAPSKEMTLEPLYRRAKHVNHVREIPKIPNVTFGVGNSNQYKMDDRNDASYFPNIGNQSAPTSKKSLVGGL